MTYSNALKSILITFLILNILIIAISLLLIALHNIINQPIDSLISQIITWSYISFIAMIPLILSNSRKK